MKRLIRSKYNRLIVSIIVIIVIVIVIIVYVKYRVKDEIEVPMISTDVISRPRKSSMKSTCIDGAIYKKGDMICLWGHPNPIPTSQKEIMATSYNDGFMKIDRHPFLLFKNGSLRIHRHWWELDNVRFVLQGYETTPGYYFIQVDEGLYYISNVDMRLLTNNIYDKMVLYENTPYALWKGRLYKCPSAMEFATANFKLHMKHWEIEPINFIGGFDVRFMDIVDVSVASNDELILVIDSGKVLYIPSSQESDLINGRYLKDVVGRKVKYQNKFRGIKLDLHSNTRSIVTSNHCNSWKALPIHRIILGDTADTFLIFYNHDIALIRHDKIIMKLSGITDATLDSTHLYTINIDGILRKYNYQQPDTLSRYQHQTLLHNVSNIFITYDHLTIISISNIVSKLS